MTTRARWILAICICGMVLGLLFREQQYSFLILNLIFIFWIAVEWIVFRVKTLRADQIFKSIERTIDGSSARAQSISLNQEYEVELGVALEPSLSGLRFFIRDLVPNGLESSDRWPAVVDLQLQTQVKWKYKIVPRVTGELALPGIQVTVTDKFGFFRLQKFIPHRQVLTLLPFIMQPKTTAEQVKRDNIQLMAGHHRFKKSGVSSELLGIREYQKGDPPRSIAWKATARTGKLMTCEYESEVPIRATILADVSGHQFWGRPGPAPFDSIASAVGSITKLLIEDKDPVGVILAAGENKTRIRPGLGQRQLIRILQSLLRSAPGSTAASEYSIYDLAEFVWKSIYRIQPELVSDTLNNAKVPLLMYGPRRRYQFSIRRQTAVALNWLLNGDVAEGAKLTFNDELYREKCNEFFSRYPSVVNEAPLVTDFGSGRKEKEAAVRNLCAGLIESVARAEDNELFLLIGDFNVRPYLFREFVNAVRVARSRYHRVMIINVPSNDVAKGIQDVVARQAFDYIQSLNLNEEVRHYAAIQQLGASVAFLDDLQLMEKIVGEIQILKTGGSRGPVTSARAGSH